MKLSNKTLYGIQFMFNLAINYGEEYINIKDIANKENISVKFLENIVSIIKPSNLIKVKRGSAGGYRLSKSPGEITLLEIILVLEGEMFSLSGNQNEKKNQASDITYIISNLLDKIQQNLFELLEKVTLADMVKEYNEKKNNLMFYI